jgi:hypothetical protein
LWYGCRVVAVGEKIKKLKMFEVEGRRKDGETNNDP